VCGGRDFEESAVLARELVDAWELGVAEAAYINRQQGMHCQNCGTSLRSMALATAISAECGAPNRLLPHALAAKAWWRVLEINSAGQVSHYLRLLPRHTRVDYPTVDMQDLPFDDCTFDMVVHSDTLEHVPDPGRGLRESHRVLKPGGRLCFTVPIVVARRTRDRRDLPPSFHGTTSDPGMYLVHTEYGSDVWLDVLRAGFSACTIYGHEVPGGLALGASRQSRSRALGDRVIQRSLGLAHRLFTSRRPPAGGPRRESGGT
jgi:SAM-dependent methyltransferase